MAASRISPQHQTATTIKIVATLASSFLHIVATNRKTGTRQMDGDSGLSVHRRRADWLVPTSLGHRPEFRSNALLVRRLDSLPLLAGSEPLFQIRNSGFLEPRLHGLRNRQRLLVITGRIARLPACLERLSQDVVHGRGVRRQRFRLLRFGKGIRRILCTEEPSRFLYVS